VDTGGAIVGRHDGSENLLSLGYGSRTDVRYLNVLFPDGSRPLLVEAVLRLEPGALLVPSMSGRAAFFERVSEADAERVFLVS
jgi:hypothetical protein